MTEPLDVMADAISRGVRLHLDVFDAKEVGGWCDVCELPSMAELQVRAIGSDGAYDIGSMPVCIKCTLGDSAIEHG